MGSVMISLERGQRNSLGMAAAMESLPQLLVLLMLFLVPLFMTSSALSPLTVHMGAISMGSFCSSMVFIAAGCGVEGSRVLSLVGVSVCVSWSGCKLDWLVGVCRLWNL